MPKEPSHGTGDEIDFVSQIGRFTDSGKNIGQKNMVRLYINAAARRTDWGKIDRNAVLAFAHGRLAELEARERNVSPAVGRTFSRVAA